ncbi:hypothetical protein ACFQJD_18355 [Haloplanus sp. GCM10025708]|uniref:DUF7535 family protein n=1 Tax=Haloferacaceae TaxID=1644056 RepID=UPI00361F6C7F
MSSEAQPEGEPGALTKAYGALSPEYRPHPDAEMDAIGWSIFLAMLVLLVPLLPFLVLVWLVTKAMDALAGR